MTGRLKTSAQVIALACVAGLLALLVWSVVHQQHAPGVGSMAPAFTLHRLDGARQGLARVLQGEAGRAELLGVVVRTVQE